jgi:Plasmid pRiA4b ORF-3-like protein
MEAEQKVGAVRLSARLRGVSPAVIRRLLITEQSSLAELHANLQVSFGWSDQHLYSFQIRGWQFGDPARAIELELAGGGVDIPLAAFGFDIGEPFLYQYNLLVPWEIECRIEALSPPLLCGSFAVGLGLTWLATIPPTASIVGKLFGIRYLSTLFGLTLLSHQIGGFLGAYLGGLALVRFGNYQWMWYADMALAAAAALINLPIREARIALVPSAT